MHSSVAFFSNSLKIITFGKILGATYSPRFHSIVTCRLSSTKSRMNEFYRDKNIFITGATGFLGKALLEKLLSACPDVGRVYILIRSKRNLTVKDRLEQLNNEPIFTKYRRVETGNMLKIVGIEGHFGNIGLEISDKDRKTLIDHVNIVFHSASTVRFDEPLDVAMKNIFLGSKTMLTLANDMQHLSSFVYVSTAFVNAQLLTSDERVYDMQIDGDSVLSFYENNSKENVEQFVRKNYFEGRPNTYVFAKALTENYIREHCRRLPVIITRPSIVTGALLEPEPGYCDSPSAASYGIIYQGLGICRYQPINETALADIIPIDVVVNSLLIVAREVALQMIPVTSVYNVSLTGHWTLTHKQIADYKLNAFIRAPPVSALRSFSHRTTKMSHLEQFSVKYFSELPFAVLMDMISKICGHKSRLLKLTRAIQSTRDDQAIFYQKTWLFPRKNMDAAIGRLSKEDRKLFPALPIVKDANEYIYKYWLSLREFKLRETSDNIEAGRRHQKRLLIRSRVVSFTMAACFIISAAYIFYERRSEKVIPILFKQFKDFNSQLQE